METEGRGGGEGGAVEPTPADSSLDILSRVFSQRTAVPLSSFSSALSSTLTTTGGGDLADGDDGTNMFRDSLTKTPLKTPIRPQYKTPSKEGGGGDAAGGGGGGGGGFGFTTPGTSKRVVTSIKLPSFGFGTTTPSDALKQVGQVSKGSIFSCFFHLVTPVLNLCDCLLL